MRDIDGTVTISLSDYEWMKNRIEEYEALLNLAKRINHGGTASQYREYLIDVNELITEVIVSKGCGEADVVSIKQLSDTDYHVKAEIDE